MSDAVVELVHWIYQIRVFDGAADRSIRRWKGADRYVDSCSLELGPGV